MSNERKGRIIVKGIILPIAFAQGRKLWQSRIPGHSTVRRSAELSARFTDLVVATVRRCNYTPGRTGAMARCAPECNSNGNRHFSNYYVPALDPKCLRHVRSLRSEHVRPTTTTSVQTDDGEYFVLPPRFLGSPVARSEHGFRTPARYKYRSLTLMIDSSNLSEKMKNRSCAAVLSVFF